MYQTTIIIGNVGRDPESRFTPAGKRVTSFSVAVNKRWKDADGQDQEKVTWFRVATWGKLADVCAEYLTKGRQVMVEGEVDASAWLATDGTARASLELTARTVKFLGSKQGAPESDEDMPF